MKILKRLIAYFTAIMVLSAVFVSSAFAEDIKKILDKIFKCVYNIIEFSLDELRYQMRKISGLK